NSGLKKLVHTKEYPFSKFKNVYSKYPGATFNDLSWTLIVRALLKWTNHNEHNNENKKFSSICGVMGISARKDLEEFEMNNQSGGQLVNYYYEEDFSKSIENIKKIIEPLKNKNMM